MLFGFVLLVVLPLAAFVWVRCFWWLCCVRMLLGYCGLCFVGFVACFRLWVALNVLVMCDWCFGGRFCGLKLAVAVMVSGLCVWFGVLLQLAAMFNSVVHSSF